MRTPKKVKRSKLGTEAAKKVKVMNSSLKGAAKAVSATKINTKGPAMGKAAIEIQADGSWKASVKCLNGDPRRNVETFIPKGSNFVHGKPLPEKGDVSVILPDGLKIDPAAIFPWDSRQDPSNHRGGIGKGQIKEGAQDPGRSGPPVPVTWPLIISDWVNGAVVRLSFYMNNPTPQSFYPGDSGFFYYIIDELGEASVKVLVKTEGDCLNLGQGHIEKISSENIIDE